MKKIILIALASILVFPLSANAGFLTGAIATMVVAKSAQKVSPMVKSYQSSKTSSLK